MTTVSDAKLSDLTDMPVTWVCDSKGKVTISFHVKGDTDTRGRHYYTKRVVTSRYFSNHSVDTVRYDNKRYLIDSKVELVEAPL